MAKVITVKYEQKERGGESAIARHGLAGMGADVASDPEKAFTDAMDLLAESYQAHGSQADFGIVDSADISDICLSSQCFFPWGVESALQRRGIMGVGVRGVMGGTSYSVLEKIRESGEDIEFLDGRKYARSPVLYRFEREE